MSAATGPLSVLKRLIVGSGIALLYPLAGTLHCVWKWWQISYEENTGTYIGKRHITNKYAAEVLPSTLKRSFVLETIAFNLAWFTAATCITLAILFITGTVAPFAFLGLGSGILAGTASIAFLLTISMAMIGLLLAFHYQHHYLLDVLVDAIFNKKLKITVYVGLVAALLLCSQFGLGVFVMPTLFGIAPLPLLILTVLAFTLLYIAVERGAAMAVKGMLRMIAVLYGSIIAKLTHSSRPAGTSVLHTTLYGQDSASSNPGIILGLLETAFDQVMGERHNTPNGDTSLTACVLRNDTSRHGNKPRIITLLPRAKTSYQGFWEQQKTRQERRCCVKHNEIQTERDATTVDKAITTVSAFLI